VGFWNCLSEDIIRSYKKSLSNLYFYITFIFWIKTSLTWLFLRLKLYQRHSQHKWGLLLHCLMCSYLYWHLLTFVTCEFGLFQVGWGFDQPSLVEGVAAHGRGVGMRWSIRFLPNQTILWFYDSTNITYSLLNSDISVLSKTICVTQNN